mmetsp:Transcript_19979/g.30246  ORF Transcript_19979/g.30246 Transcript_19979/m.30246 type:complete len:117 (+) Transcript_19979:91-441(+)
MPRPKAIDPERQLVIKTRSVERLAKEANYYKEETKENQDKLQKMKDENKDHYDIKKFAEVLEESEMMIPDSENRLKKAVNDLAQFLEGHENHDGSSELNSEEWLNRAKELVQAQSS